MTLVCGVLTADNMRKVVEEEGLEARNLLNWNVIVSDKPSLEIPKTSKKPPASPRPQSVSPKLPVNVKEVEPHVRSTKRCSSLGRPKTRLRSSSAGRNPDKCVRARYWAFLFENLYRAVDEIYQTCEVDESIVESKEAIMMLDNYGKEFQALIQWLTISKSYEVTPPRNRPTSLAWEVRKSLPSKGLLRNLFWDKLGSTGPGARRKLDLQGSLSVAVQTNAEHTVPNEILKVEDIETVPLISNENTISKPPSCVINVVSPTPENVQLLKTDKNVPFILAVQTPDNSAVLCEDEVKSICENGGNNLGRGKKFHVEFLGRDERHDEIDSKSAVTKDYAIPALEVEKKTLHLSVESAPVEKVTTVSTRSNIESCCITKGNIAKVRVPDNQIIIEKEKPSVPNHVHITENKSVKLVNLKHPKSINRVTIAIQTDPYVKKINESAVLQIDSIVTATKMNATASTMKIDSKKLETTAAVLKVNSAAATKKIDTTVSRMKIDSKILETPATVLETNSTNETKEVDETAATIKVDTKKLETTATILGLNPATATKKDDTTAVAAMVKSDSTATAIESNFAATKNKVDSTVTVNKVSTISTVKTIDTTAAVPLSKPHVLNALAKPWKPTITPVIKAPVKKPLNNSIATNSITSSTKPVIPAVQARAPLRPILNTKSFTTRSTNAMPASSDKTGSKITNSATITRRTVPSASVVARVNVPKPAIRQVTAPLIQRTRPSTHHLSKDLTNAKMKSVSSTTLNVTSTVKIKKCDSEGNIDNADDSDGWETVRGRTRCKNSPAKKTPPANGAYTQEIAAKIKHSKIGGFPYTCTSNSQSVQKKPVKPSQITSKKPVSNNETDDDKVKQSVTDVKSSKSSKDNTKVVVERKNVSLKQNENIRKGVGSQKPTNIKSNVSKPSTAKQLAASDNKKDSTSLRKSHSCSTFEVKKKTLTSKEPTSVVKTKTKSTVAGNARPVEKDSSAKAVEKSTEGRKRENETENIKKDIPKVDVVSSENSKLVHGDEELDIKDSSIQLSADDVDKLVPDNVDGMKNNDVDSLKIDDVDGLKIGDVDGLNKDVDSLKIDDVDGLKVDNVDGLNNDVDGLKIDDVDGLKIDDVDGLKIDDVDGLKIDDVDGLKIDDVDGLKIDDVDGLNDDDVDGLNDDDVDGLKIDDVDGLNDDDDDAETLEMYERMIREEAQEHISDLGLSWGDQMDLLDMEFRTPGRALQMHEKLSSPFRKKTLAETIRLQEEKQLKAQEQRERFLEEKAQRFKEIQKKVEEMKALNERKQEQQRISLEMRLQRAEEKRKKELEKIVKRAHDEKEKVNEIAFINSLEAQNKRHDLISKEKDHEARLLDIQEERQKKLEEKAAKEAAAEERRNVLEAERLARVVEMQEKRKQKDLKIEQQLMEKEKERQELANQKARDRELRISALNAAQQATVEQLQKKIQLKQEESARRHEENIELIRQKAFELSVRRYSSNNDDTPQLVPYETKKICTVCNVIIASEVYLLSHLRGKKHQEMITLQHQGQNPSTEDLELYNLKHIVNVSTDQIDPKIALGKERLKALKKRCKKLRQRMANRGAEFEQLESTNVDKVKNKHKQKMLKVINDIKKYTSCADKGPWDSAVALAIERIYNESERLLNRWTHVDKIAFCDLGGVKSLMDLLIKIATSTSNNNNLVPTKVIIKACQVTLLAFKDCYENSIHVLLNNRIGVILDTLLHKLRYLIPDNFDKLVECSSTWMPPVDDVAGEIMRFLSVVLDYLTKKKIGDPVFCEAVMKQLQENQAEEFRLRINDIVSYTVSIGIVDRLTQYFNSIRGPIDSNSKLGSFLVYCMSFLVAVVKLTSDSYTSVFDNRKIEDPTQVLATLKMTDLIGSVSLLYCILLHDGSQISDTKPSQLPEHTVLLTLAALRMLNHTAVLNLHVVQSMLGSEGLSLQLRHISNYILWYCKHWPSMDLLHEVILLIGYLTADNPDNQLIVHAGQSPSVLKQLSTLPIVYFSNGQLSEILFPTLISCCFQNDCNKSVLRKEMSIQLLSHYIEAYLLDGCESDVQKYDPNIRWRLIARFPKGSWPAAKAYFTS